MSTYYGQQFPHFLPQQAFDLGSHTFSFEHHGARSKTPTDSLVNHTGLSPGPLTTPPHSRHVSQPPEASYEQNYEHMLCDNGSLSTSPTSIRTPDGEYSEVDMREPDLHFFQQHNMNPIATQGPNSTILANDQDMFLSNQGRTTLVYILSIN